MQSVIPSAARRFEVSLLADSINGQTIAIIHVADHGPGVPEPDLVNVFRPFYRVADSRERETGGVGLGLAITDQANRLHGGAVSARNSPLGGLIVELRLPAISQPIPLLYRPLQTITLLDTKGRLWPNLTLFEAAPIDRASCKAACDLGRSRASPTMLLHEFILLIEARI